VRQPRVAELIADALRRPILSGEIPEGGSLPRQEVLIERFKASLTSVREALRILELEGLITIRRGNVGGSIVHRPNVVSAAYNLGLLLQSRAVRLEDVAQTLRQLEPYCARLCAERPDRGTQLVPNLREIAKHGRDVAGDRAFKWNETAREFHRAIVQHCGGETVSALVEALVLLWSGHEASWMRYAGDKVVSPSTKLRLQICDAHDEVLDAIEEGDGRLAEKLWRAHLGTAQRFHFAVDERQHLDATLLRDLAQQTDM
jgi:GntR family transcriptional repressor for pyruvate dehydrogenase complex